MMMKFLFMCLRMFVCLYINAPIVFFSGYALQLVASIIDKLSNLTPSGINKKHYFL